MKNFYPAVDFVECSEEYHFITFCKNILLDAEEEYDVGASTKV